MILNPYSTFIICLSLIQGPLPQLTKPTTETTTKSNASDKQEEKKKSKATPPAPPSVEPGNLPDLWGAKQPLHILLCLSVRYDR